MTKNVTKPVGLAPLVSRVEQICANAALYRSTELVKPPHFLLCLDEGNGRSTAAAYIARAFAAYEVRTFGGLDRLLEYRLDDGTMADVKQMLADIQANAVFTNDFEGVVAIDPAGLSRHLNEAQTKLFLEQLPVLGRHATLALFAPSEPDRNTAQLLDKLRAALPDLEAIELPAYSGQELAEITRRILEDGGVEPENSEALDEALLDAVRLKNARTARDAKQLAAALAQQAEIQDGRPILRAQQIRGLFRLEPEKKEVRS